MPLPPIIKGDYRFASDQSFEGMIGGTATVAAGVKVDQSGMVGGDLVVEKGATVTPSGMVGGKIVNHGTIT